MRYLISAAAIALFALPVSAATLQPISAHQALANEGRCVVIQGTASVRSDPQRPGYNLDIDGKDSSAFGYILPQNKAQFPELESLDGKQVAISGVVHLYLGRAEIQMTSASQLSPGGSSSGGLTNVGPEYARGGASAICG